MLYDDFLALSSRFGVEKQIASEMMVFRIQNVADYVFSQPKEVYDLKADCLSCFTPGDPCTWLEFQMPTLSNNEGTIMRNDLGGYHFGILIIENISSAPDKLNSALAMWFSDFPFGQLRWNGTWMFSFGKDGRFVVDPRFGRTGIASFNHEEIFCPEFLKGLSMEDRASLVHMGTMGVLIMALNLLSCKNVTRIPHLIPPRLIKKKEKKGKPYFEKFYTLQIEPMTKILATEGRAGETGIKQALHICRGHFKTYEEKPLFGKFQGTYWWPAHARGSIEIGRIKKDYEIKKINIGIPPLG
jgi:hypothetical protein